jgi:hypothetical protein
LPVDYAGNSLSAAKILTLTSTVQTHSDWVGKLDTDDFYRMSLSSYGTLATKFYNATAPITAQVIQDKNNNNIIDAGEVLYTLPFNATSAGMSTNSTIPGLAAGTYFLRISPGNSNAETDYKVDLSAQAINAAPDNLQFTLYPTTVNWSDTLNVSNAWVRDLNGVTDLARVDFKLKRADGTFIDVAVSPMGTKPVLIIA